MISPRLALAATVAALASTVAADLQVLSPGGPNLWWVAQSINTIAWNCHESQYQNFTILIGNSNPSVLVQPQAIISIEPNYDCSKSITQQQEAFPAGSGYFIQLANPFNSTDVYAQSQPFEIKPLGSAYPDASATPTEAAAGASNTASGGSSGSGSQTGAAAAQTSSPSNSATGVKSSLAGVAAVAAGVLSLMFA